jgi:hypothetical protein
MKKLIFILAFLFLVVGCSSPSSVINQDSLPQIPNSVSNITSNVISILPEINLIEKRDIHFRDKFYKLSEDLNNSEGYIGLSALVLAILLMITLIYKKNNFV